MPAGSRQTMQGEWGMKEEHVRGYRPKEASVGLNDEDTDGLSSTRARVTVPAERDKFQETRLFLPHDPNLMVLGLTATRRPESLVQIPIGMLVYSKSRQRVEAPKAVEETELCCWTWKDWCRVQLLVEKKEKR